MLKTILDKLYEPALRALSVPASSAPLEHVFTYDTLHIKAASIEFG